MSDGPNVVTAAESIVQQLEDGKVPSMREAKSIAGYKSHAKASKTFQRVLFEIAPMERLASIQRRQAYAREVKRISWGRGADPKVVARICVEHEDWKLLRLWRDHEIIYTLIEQPNYDVIDKALDKFYKLGGFYAAEKVEHQVSRPLEETTEAELDKMIAQHIQTVPVKQDTTTPNVITGLPAAEIIEGEAL